MIRVSKTLEKIATDTSSHIEGLSQHVNQLRRLLENSRGRTVVITGAGISTDSGIPDYRGPNGVYVRNKDFKPIQYQQFVQQHTFRQRYWARSFLGWPKILSSQPNASHHALTALQHHSFISNIITQNVDRLHTRSGAIDVVELHGSLHEVECTTCRHVTSRVDQQQKLAKLNPQVAAWATQNRHRDGGDVASSVNPDGDVDITWDYDAFLYPSCPNCGGLLKPKVVFFGENMPSSVKHQSLDKIDDATSVLVVGSSLQVLSALRLITRAKERNLTIGILNLGPTRGDEFSQVRVDANCTNVLSALVKEMGLQTDT